MLDPAVRERLAANAAELDTIAEVAARNMDIAVSADARQRASDIRLMILAAENDSPADRPSYAQLMATAVQYERILILLILQAGGELRLTAHASVEHGEEVIKQRRRIVHHTDEASGDFVLTAPRSAKLT